jgi:hypothetical protein
MVCLADTIPIKAEMNRMILGEKADETQEKGPRYQGDREDDDIPTKARGKKVRRTPR